MEELAIIPRPARLERRSGELARDAAWTLSYPDGAAAAGRLCSELLGQPCGAGLERVGDGATIQLVLGDVAVPGGRAGDVAATGTRARRSGGEVSAGAASVAGGTPVATSDPGAGSTKRLEGYHLSVDTERVLAVSPTPAGLCNAVQTMRQLLGPGAFRRAPVPGAARALPAVEIEDEPAFSWRGGHLDVARHMMPDAFLFRFVDLLAMHKLNVCHLHLTDDQGWRLPSSRWPRLAEIASWRRETIVGHALDPRHGGGHVNDGTPHGGYYSAATLRSLVAYAAQRNVTVVPEIDLPGHVQAAIAAYPELGSAAEPLEVLTYWTISDHVLNCSERAMQFCADVVEELLEIFPSRYVHLGGDEVPRREWSSDPAVQARMAELGLPGPDALQGWFTARMAALLAANDRRLVGWDEIVECGPLPAGATVMSWRGEQGGILAAGAGYDVVMCPELPCYFDHYQSDLPEEPLAIRGHNTWEDVYRFSPLPGQLAADDGAAHVLGTQFQLWSEYLPDPAAVEYMAFPRAAALAEVAWSGPGGEEGEFRPRLQRHLSRLDELGVNYRPLGGPRPWQAGGTGARRRFDPFI
jgi:hexosaminidase